MSDISLSAASWSSAPKAPPVENGAFSLARVRSIIVASIGDAQHRNELLVHAHVRPRSSPSAPGDAHTGDRLLRRVCPVGGKEKPKIAAMKSSPPAHGRLQGGGGLGSGSRRACWSSLAHLVTLTVRPRNVSFVERCMWTWPGNAHGYVCGRYLDLPTLLGVGTNTWQREEAESDRLRLGGYGWGALVSVVEPHLGSTLVAPVRLCGGRDGCVAASIFQGWKRLMTSHLVFGTKLALKLPGGPQSFFSYDGAAI